MSDRREVPRTVTLVRVKALDGGEPMMGQDIGLDGMLVTTSVPRWPGSMIPMRFRLPGQDRAICVTGRVVDLIEIPGGVGVGLFLRFLALDPEAEIAIHRYVDERPLPEFDNTSIASQIDSWMGRIVEDCKQLKALARR